MLDAIQLSNITVGPIHWIWGNMIPKISPPDLPFLVGRKKPTTSHSVMPNELDHPQSPGKQIMYRSECMDQPNKWHTLMEKQIIIQEQYKNFIGMIVQDIENLWLRMYICIPEILWKPVTVYDCAYVNMYLPGVLYRQIVVRSGGPCPKQVWMISTMNWCKCIDVIPSPCV